MWDFKVRQRFIQQVLADEVPACTFQHIPQGLLMGLLHLGLCLQVHLMANEVFLFKGAVRFFCCTCTLGLGPL